MVRTQVQLSEEQTRALRAQAARDNVSVSELVRRAVDAWLRRARSQSEAELKQRAIAAAGRFGSGAGDVARDHDRFLDVAYRS